MTSGPHSPRVPDHEMVRRIGAGSYGEVWLARNVIGTWRAVKVVYRSRFDNDRPYEREFAGIQKFEPISRSHEGLVDLLQIGRNDAEGYFYYVMELADNSFGDTTTVPAVYEPRTLSSEFRQRGRMPLEDCLRLGLSLTSALGHLHRQGLVHRDIKPSNIIIVRGQPKLADIGLVAELGEARSFVGTEGFIPPEGPGTPQSDIYSLGKVLYEMSTGFDRLDFPRLPLAFQNTGERAGLSELNEIILKACLSNSAERYQSASEMHAELSLLELGKSVRRLRRIERQFANLKRIGAVAAILLVLAASAWVGQFRESGKTKALAVAENRERLRAESALTHMELQRAEDLFQSDNSSAALAALAHILRQQPTNSVASHRLLSALTHRSIALPLAQPLAHASAVSCMQFVPTASAEQANGVVVTGCEDGSVRFWNGIGGRAIGPVLKHPGAVTALAISSDGACLAAAVQGGVYLWRWQETNREPIVLSHKAPIAAVVFSPSGKFVGTASEDGTASVWERATGEPVTGMLKHSKPVRSIDFSADGERIVTSSDDGQAVVWSKTNQVVLRHRGPVTQALFSPDGKSVVTTCLDGSIFLWDSVLGTQRNLPAMKHPKSVTNARWSPNGHYVATGSWDYTAQIWDAETGQRVCPPMRHAGYVNSVRFSPDGRRLLTASWDHTARVWDVLTGEPLTDPLRHQDRTSAAEFSSDGLTVATASFDGSAQLWDIRPGEMLPDMVSHQNWVRAVAFSPDGLRMATVGNDSAGRVWETSTGRPLTPWLQHKERTLVVRFTPDGKRLLTADHSGRAFLWDSFSGKKLSEPVRHAGLVIDADISPDGKLAATASFDGSAWVWSLVGEPSVLSRIQHTNALWSVCFSPDGKLVATASDDGLARIWEAKSGKAATDWLRHERAIYSAKFSRDGKYLVTASADHTARIWSVQTGRPVSEPLRHGDIVKTAEFSPDGRLVLTASYDRTARLWDAGTSRAVTHPFQHTMEVFEAHFSPDGEWVATGSADGTARVWDVNTGLPLSEPLRHRNEVLCLRFSPSGQNLLTGSKDTFARSWKLARFPLPLPDWVAAMGEAAAGQHLNERNVPEMVPHARLLDIRERVLGQAREDDIVVWANWFFADRSSRNVQAGRVTTPQFVEERIKDDTRASLEMAVRLDPGNARAWGHLAGKLVLQTNIPTLLKEAAWCSEYALRLRPEDQELQRIRGDVCLAAGLLSEAQLAFRKLLEKEPVNAGLWDSLARSFILEQKWTEAREASNQALALSATNSPEARAFWKKRLLERSAIKRELGQWKEAGDDYALANGYAFRPSNLLSNLFDLTLAYNAHLEESWQLSSLPGNDLTELPPSPAGLAGILFDVRGVIQLRSLRLKSGPYPEETELPIQGTWRRLHFLHGAGWTDEPGTEISRIVVEYANGQKEPVPFIYGEDVFGWWTESPSRPPPSRAALAWTGKNPAVREVNQSIQLFRTTWQNPHPEWFIQRLRYISAKTNAAPFLLGVTGE